MYVCECCSVQPAVGRWQHAANAPTNTVAPMPMASANAVTTSRPGAEGSQPQLTNAAAANLLAGPGFLNQYPSGLAGLSPLLAAANLGNTGLPGANAAGVGGAQPALGNPNAAADPYVELASALSRMMLNPNILANMSFGLPGFLGLAQLNNAAIQQSLLQGASGTSLLSPADQQQVLRSAGLLPPLPQTATHTTFSSGVHSATTASASAPLGHGHSGLGGQSANLADSTFAHSLHESAHPRNFSQHLPPR